MTTKRMTIQVSKIRERANKQLSRKDSDFYSYKDNSEWLSGFRAGIQAMTEFVLHETGNYCGFNYVDWLESGCDEWKAAGEPKDNTSYLGNQDKRFYY